MTLRRKIDEPKTGMPLLVDEGSPWRPELSVWEIVAHEEEMIQVVKRSDPDRAMDLPTDTLSSHGRQAVWTHALPDVPEENLVGIYTILKDSRHTHHAFLFEVGSRDEEGNARLELITDDKPPEAGRDLSTLHLHADFAVRMKDEDPVLTRYPEGTVILLRPRHTLDDDIDRVVLTEGEAIDTGMTRQQAEEVLGVQTGPFRMSAWPVGGYDELEMELGFCIAKHETDRVVVLVMDTGTLERPDNGYAVLHVSGSRLYWNDTISDEMWGTPLGHGIWIGTDIAWHDAGEDGAEWDASWQRATIADMIEHGLTDEEVLDHLSDTLERDVTLTDVHALFAEEWTTPIPEKIEGEPDRNLGKEAMDWIGRVEAILPHVSDKSRVIQDLPDGGLVITLRASGRIAASVTVQEDERFGRVLTRWLDEDPRDRFFDSDLARWRMAKSDE